MKKVITLLFTVLLSNLLIGAEVSELQMAEAKFFTAEAKKQFNLSDSAADKVLQIKLDSYVQIREKVVKLRKDGNEEKAKAVAQEINNELINKFIEIVRCKRKDYMTFSKETREKFLAENKK